MKLILTALVLCFVGVCAQAEPQKKESTNTSKKSTEVNFDDVLVQGKYYFSDENVTTVDQEKVADSLLKVRKDFKDRVKKSTARY